MRSPTERLIVFCVMCGSKRKVRRAGQTLSKAESHSRPNVLQHVQTNLTEKNKSVLFFLRSFIKISLKINKRTITYLHIISTYLSLVLVQGTETLDIWISDSQTFLLPPHFPWFACYIELSGALNNRAHRSQSLNPACLKERV